MKNISIIFNIVLTIAVGVLYFLHFNLKSDCYSTPTVGLATSKATNGIVYVNSDSLLNNYELYKQSKKTLEDKNKRLEAELSSKMQQLQNEAAAYQQRAGGMTNEQRQATEEGLMMKQQQLAQRRDELGQQLMSEEQKMTEQLYTTIAEYIKKYNAKGSFQYVLGFSKGGGILYANDSLDITKQVIDGLNKEFKEKK